MSVDTWNFPCWQCRDLGPGSSRGTAGQNYTVEGQTLPFVNSLSGVFSFFAESGKVADDHTLTLLMSIGRSGNVTYAPWEIGLRMTTDPAKTSRIEFRAKDHASATTRYNWRVGDEDGVNWLQFNKWYQVAFSVNATRLLIAVNGSTTYTVNKVTDAPGALNMNEGSERIWYFGPSAGYGFANPISIGNSWPSCVVGPAAYDASDLDLTSQSVLDRIFDADGNLKNPGENGSLWFNDAYTTAANFKPDIYLNDGGARLENGSASLTWITYNSSNVQHAPGGLRKMYE